MRNNPTLKKQWAKILASGQKMRPGDSDKFNVMYGHRTPAYGQYMRVMGDCPDELIADAKRLLYDGPYLAMKVNLRNIAGVTLSEPVWVVKRSSVITTIGWKAYADKHITNEAYHRMELARKRALKSLEGKKL